METLGVAELLVILVLVGALVGPGILAELVVRMIGSKADPAYGALRAICRLISCRANLNSEHVEEVKR